MTSQTHTSLNKRENLELYSCEENFIQFSLHQPLSSHGWTFQAIPRGTHILSNSS